MPSVPERSGMWTIGGEILERPTRSWRGGRGTGLTRVRLQPSACPLPYPCPCPCPAPCPYPYSSPCPDGHLVLRPSVDLGLHLSVRLPDLTGPVFCHLPASAEGKVRPRLRNSGSLPLCYLSPDTRHDQHRESVPNPDAAHTNRVFRLAGFAVGCDWIERVLNHTGTTAGKPDRRSDIPGSDVVGMAIVVTAHIRPLTDMIPGGSTHRRATLTARTALLA